MKLFLLYPILCTYTTKSFPIPSLSKWNHKTVLDRIKRKNIVFMFRDDEELFAELNNNDSINTKEIDTSKCLTRQLRLGEDFSVTKYIGNMGFEEVTDWEYYYEEDSKDKKRVVVQPLPLDPAMPKRTRSSSGSVVRLFRGEMQGVVSSMLRSRGMDSRVLIKEFSGEKALELARAELNAISILQSDLCDHVSKTDSMQVFKLMELLVQAPFMGILGTVNVTDMLSDQTTNDANTWYRALGTGPPVYNSIWIVYPYAGLSSLQSYASKPPIQRILQSPPRKGFFGNPLPPNPLPSWDLRANYIINGIFKQSLQALAFLHDNGIVHRSIGRSSIYLSTKLLDKNLPSSPYATSPTQLITKLSDFGFARTIAELANDAHFRSTARTYKLLSNSNDVDYLTLTRFAIAEDLHALGFVFLGILLATLSEPEIENNTYLPIEDETLLRLLNDIFSQDFKQFRSYIQNEGNVYQKLIALLDENDGWTFLESMCFARERVYQKKDDLVILTASGLLGSSFFKFRT